MTTPPPPAIGIDFGGTSIKAGLVRGGTVLEHGNNIDTQAASGPDQLIAEMAEEVRAIRSVHPDVKAVGVGLPGLINPHLGVVHTLSNVRGWTEIPLAKLLEKATGLPVVIENDANAMAWGEFLFGAGQGVHTIVALTLGTGVGAGIIVEDRLFRGASMTAGEIGQMSIQWEGLPGQYGNFGALEKYVGNRQIAERAAAAFAKAGKPCAEEVCTPEHLSRLASAGDPVAIAIWQETGEMIGACLANVAWLINPNRFIIGGGIAKAGNLIFDPIRKALKSRVSDVISKETDIVPATLGTAAGMVGCAALGLAKAGIA